MLMCMFLNLFPHGPTPMTFQKLALLTGIHCAKSGIRCQQNRH